MRITFHGARGSTPCSSHGHGSYGGNTSCVAVEADDTPPILFDLGTGLLRYSDGVDGPFRGVMLLTHLHWDHVQGLPFFSPLLRPGAKVRILGPPQDEGPLREVLVSFVRPPFFPVTVDDLPGEIMVEEIDRESIEIGSAVVTAARIPHPGATNGYRVDHGGKSVVFIPDHQGLENGWVDPEVIELARDTDLLIHDSQFTHEEFIEKIDWGHCTADYALTVAAAAGVSRLALFHHDPDHDDEALEAIASGLSSRANELGIDVFLAAEGMSIDLADQPSPHHDSDPGR